MLYSLLSQKPQAEKHSISVAQRQRRHESSLGGQQAGPLWGCMCAHVVHGERRRDISQLMNVESIESYCQSRDIDLDGDGGGIIVIRLLELHLRPQRFIAHLRTAD